MAKETLVEKARKKFQKKRYEEDSSTQEMPMSSEEKSKMTEAYETEHRKRMMEEMERKATQELKLKKLEKKLKGVKI